MKPRELGDRVAELQLLRGTRRRAGPARGRAPRAVSCEETRAARRAASAGERRRSERRGGTRGLRVVEQRPSKAILPGASAAVGRFHAVRRSKAISRGGNNGVRQRRKLFAAVRSGYASARARRTARCRRARGCCPRRWRAARSPRHAHGELGQRQRRTAPRAGRAVRADGRRCAAPPPGSSESGAMVMRPSTWRWGMAERGFQQARRVGGLGAELGGVLAGVDLEQDGQAAAQFAGGAVEERSAASRCRRSARGRNARRRAGPCSTAGGR